MKPFFYRFPPERDGLLASFQTEQDECIPEYLRLLRRLVKKAYQEKRDLTRRGTLPQGVVVFNSTEEQLPLPVRQLLYESETTKVAAHPLNLSQYHKRFPMDESGLAEFCTGYTVEDTPQQVTKLLFTLEHTAPALLALQAQIIEVEEGISIYNCCWNAKSYVSAY